MTNVPLILQSKSIDWFLLYEMDIGRYKVNRYTVHFKDVAKKVSNFFYRVTDKPFILKMLQKKFHSKFFYMFLLIYLVSSKITIGVYQNLKQNRKTVA